MRVAFRPLWPVVTGAMLASLVVAAVPADAGPAARTEPPPAATGPTYQAPHAVAPRVRTYAVRGVDRAGLRAVSTRPAHKAGQVEAARTDLAALSGPEPATGFAVTGVTWTGKAPRDLGLAIRTRTGGDWSGWTTMDFDAEHGPSPSSAEAKKAKPGTDPFVVGEVDDVQLKVTSDSGRAPAGLRLSVVDPGTSAQDASPTPIAQDEAAEIAAPTVAGKTAPSPAATTDPVTTRRATPMPTIYSRADWGADERLRGCCVEYGEVHAGFVHHTVNANGYSRAEVPAILRGIYAYHTQSRGWRDIGYNFLIDRFGRIWEGRYGGVALPVVGAHTLNYNENSFAASAIGNYDVAHPSSAMIEAYARLYAWKLSLHGVRPRSRQRVSGTVFNAISGHRDAAQTACPGRYLYAKIPTIIDKATRYQHGFAGRVLHHSVLGDTTPDVLLVGAKGAVSVARGTGPPGFAKPTGDVTSTPFAGMDRVVPVGDVTGDGLNDLMARSAASGATAVYAGRGHGAFGGPTHSVRTWAGADLFAGVGDVTGDGRDDVVARSETTGELRVYPGHDNGRFGRARVAIAAAAGFNLVTAAGDFNRDGRRDLLTRGTHGAVLVWYGDGTGRFPTKRRIAHDWSGKDTVSGGMDLTGDHRPDVVARSRRTHVVSTFANIGGTHFSPAIGHRTTTSRFLALTADISGDGRADLVALTHARRVKVFAGSRRNWLRAPVVRKKVSWPGTDAAMIVGDWDGDGYVDAMARRHRDGTLGLYRGTSTGGFRARVGNWPGWGSRRSLTPVGDFNGDGRPDVMARTRSGAVYLYPGRGLHGFRAPVRMRSSLPSGSSIVGVGLWDNDGAPDVLVRTPSGQVLLYPGNGPGGLDDPTVIGRRYKQYASLVGVADLTGDGQSDLIGRLPSGQTWLIPGAPATAKSPAGGLRPRQFVAANWSGYRMG